MTDRPRILVNLIVVAILEALVAEEVDVLVVYTGEMLSWICLRLDMLQAVCLVPAVREDVEGDLAAN
jgi:DNA-binding transcriptional LysR family regulator